MRSVVHVYIITFMFFSVLVIRTLYIHPFIFLYMFVPLYICVNIVFCPHGLYGLLDFEIQLYIFYIYIYICIHDMCYMLVSHINAQLSRSGTPTTSLIKCITIIIPVNI